MFSQILQENQNKLKQIFANCDDFMIDCWTFGNRLQYQAFSAYFRTMTERQDDMRDTLRSVIGSIAGTDSELDPRTVSAYLEQHGPTMKTGKLVRDWDETELLLLQGYIVIFIEGWQLAVAYEAEDVPTRSVDEPMREQVVRGPNEGTVDELKVNIGLLRRRLRSSKFKVVNVETGGTTRTEVVYGYLEGVVPEQTLQLFKERIEQAKNSEILESSYIEALIEDSTFSPFPQHRYTERTDTAVAAVLDGKIIVLAEGTGTILICPGLFLEFFQSSEDYYERTIISSFIRLLRLVAFFIALTLPSFYIAFSTYHPELIPTVLLLAILDSREGIPFTSFIEAVIMLFFFELLREAGLRLPKSVGSAVSIVGALVIGEAAINAGIASPIMVVVVALTGIASFSIPQYSIAIAFRLLQPPLMIFTVTLGIFGLSICLLWILLYLTSLRTLGQPYLSPLAPLRRQQLLDSVFRTPLKQKKQ